MSSGGFAAYGVPVEEGVQQATAGPSLVQEVAQKQKAAPPAPQMQQVPQAPPPAPMPQADPRNWAQRLPRLQDAQEPQPSTDVVPPSLLLGAAGIDPSRKHGDAMDFNAQEMGDWLSQRARQGEPERGA